MTRTLLYTGKIAEPPNGHGEGLYPTNGVDLKLGLSPTIIVGGSCWNLREFNGRSVLAQTSNAGAAFLYGLKQLGEEWLHPNSEFGRFAASHAIIQPEADELMTALLELYTSPMSPADSRKMLRGINFIVTPQQLQVYKSRVFSLTPKRSRGSSSNCKRSSGKQVGETRKSKPGAAAKLSNMLSTALTQSSC